MGGVQVTPIINGGIIAAVLPIVGLTCVVAVVIMAVIGITAGTDRRTCSECGKPMYPTHNGGKPQIYCSMACKLQADYRRRREKRRQRR